MEKQMELIQKIEEIKFTKQNVYGENIEVSEPIAMKSGAGWYVGAICKTDLFKDGSQFIVEPFDRYTEYMATKAEAIMTMAEIKMDGCEFTSEVV
jgi:hypothetical protein|tara:strand:+ start:223 stop:507 length:285 start_codon:yes stop_codon:yes gene_type:complete